MTPDETLSILKMLNSMYRNANLGSDNLEGYHLMLADVPYETAKGRLPALLADHPDFAPTAPAMRNAFMGTATDEWSAQLPNGEQAWEEIRAQIKYPGAWGIPQFSHPLIERTMKAFGWNELCGCPADQMNTLRAQVERFHNQFRNDAIASLKRGTPIGQAIASWADQRKIAGLVPAMIPGEVDRWTE